MCEFCLKHGEGQKWYLQANNYSEDLLNDVRRRRMIESFAADGESTAKTIEKMNKLPNAPKFIQALVKRLIPRKMKKRHYGQVVPIEDIEKIFGFVNSIVRVACYCRHFTTGKEKRYCYGISMGPNGGKFGEIMRNVDTSFLSGPDAAGVEMITKEQAIANFHEHEKEGLCHTVWTFQTPFIGGICNCDRADCLAMRCTVTHDIPVMFRAEFIAYTDPDKCIGCRQCMRLCQFGAISYSASNKKVVIDKMKCYGCGICRSLCVKDAIRLEPRANDPVVAKIW
ncbi:MAG: 4Fe-4S binding protein [Sedimentisphaerales bacterium]|jgi:Pyruvate/2-oxoacid:ferredoxin oxidoreductase delta subunit